MPTAGGEFDLDGWWVGRVDAVEVCVWMSDHVSIAVPESGVGSAGGP